MRRNTELGLILLATLVTVGAYVLASLAEDATIPADIGPFFAIVLGLIILAIAEVFAAGTRLDEDQALTI